MSYSEEVIAGRDSASDFKSDADNCTGRANKSKRTSGASCQGLPGPDNDDCKYTYHAQRHRLFDTQHPEGSPSGGWRQVYAEMEVSVNVRE